MRKVIEDPALAIRLVVHHVCLMEVIPVKTLLDLRLLKLLFGTLSGGLGLLEFLINLLE